MVREANWRDPVYAWLAVSALGLLACQLLLGTSSYFALCVFVSLVAVILTVRAIGFATVAGVFLASYAFRFIAFGEVLKTLYGQAGGSNLAAPETTITVLLASTLGMCAAALAAAHFLKDRAVVRLKPSPESLGLVGMMCLAVAVGGFLIVRHYGDADSGELVTGGIVGAARQFIGIGYFAIVAETWRSMMLSNGRRSLSFRVVLAFGALMALGLLGASKESVALPYLTYIFTSIAYRRRITKQQIATTAAGFVVFVGLVYPVVQLLKTYEDTGGLDVDAAARFLERSVSDADYLSNEWAEMNNITPDLYDESLNYLGLEHGSGFLLGRFMLIANTDQIVSSVDEDGTYGWSLVSEALGQTLPSFINPGKTQIDTGDLLTWYYGFRGWGIIGEMTTGLPADSYAAGGWLGVLVLPFLTAFLLFVEVQVAGARLEGNPIAIFFLVTGFMALGAGISSTLAMDVRGMPQFLLLIVAMFFAADFLIVRRRGAVPLRRVAGANARSR